MPFCLSSETADTLCCYNTYVASVKGLFSGNLSLDVAEGSTWRMNRSGFCGMRSKKVTYINIFKMQLLLSLLDASENLVSFLVSILMENSHHLPWSKSCLELIYDLL